MYCCSMPIMLGDGVVMRHIPHTSSAGASLRARARRLVRQNTEAAQDLAAREAAAEEERQRVRARLTRAVRCGALTVARACGGSSCVTDL